MHIDKEQRLGALARRMKGELNTELAELREQNDQHFVFGQGDPNAEVVFVGEAPGRQEAETGRPFIGSAGKILTEMLEEIGLERASIYITNVVKDRPPGNRKPRKGEIEAYQPYLFEQLSIIRSKVVVPLGLVATKVLLQEFHAAIKSLRMKDIHGQVIEATADWGALIILPMYHPAASFYGSLSKADLQEDFGRLKELLGDDSC